MSSPPRGGDVVQQILDEVDSLLERDGLDALDTRPVGKHSGFRRFELAAALNRVRSLQVAEE